MIETYKIKNEFRKVLNEKLFNSTLILNLSQLSCKTSAKIVKVTATKCCGEEKVQKENDFKMELNGFAKGGWQVAITDSGSGRP